MKRILYICVSVLVAVMLSACGQTNPTEDNFAVVTGTDDVESDNQSIDETDEVSKDPEEDSVVQSENSALEPNENLETDSQEQNVNAEPELDLYVGEYNDYEVNEPNLEIQKIVTKHIRFKLESSGWLMWMTV